MNTQLPVFPPHFVRGSAVALEEFASPLIGLRAALVVTPDGFEVSVLQRSELNVAKLAAMTSSLMAMARAVGGELSFTECRRLIFDTRQGTVVVQPITARLPSLLCFALGPDVILGSALWSMDRVAAALHAMG